jgi:hypothetical protein
LEVRGYRYDSREAEDDFGSSSRLRSDAPPTHPSIAALAAAEAAARKVCPESDAVSRFICIGENGRLIEANTVAEVIEQMDERWAKMQRRLEDALATARDVEPRSVPLNAP